ncbi:MAG TPA: serine/threonine-protein kinase [Acidimicrobiia bacterium]
MQLIDDRYELLDVIASGGMATVWRARDTRLDRLVAVKRPHPSPVPDESAARMAREARAAASLSHPHLITVYDFGSDESGPYLVMELVDGPTLMERFAKIDASEAVEIGARLAEALAVIHAAGIVHRDVKPGNVILSERGPLLTDFGIALDPNTTAEITEPGKVVATPSYAAPEVLAGDTPTPASDVFSLAVMIDELIQKEGSDRSRDIESALKPAMSVSPGDRPNAADFAAALRRAAPTASWASWGDPTLVMEPSPSPPVPDQDDGANRSVPMWMWVAGLLVVLAAGLAVIGLTLPDGDTPADAAATPTVSTTVVPEASTTSTSAPSTTTSGPATVAATRNELEALLLQTPRSDLNPPEVEDVMKKIDEAIEAAGEEDLDKAEKKLSESAKKLDEKLEGDKRDDATLLLQQLADLLGVDLETEGQDDRDG